MTEVDKAALVWRDLCDEAATAALAKQIAPLLRAGDWLAMEGDLGAGKTAFTRALVNALPRAGDIGSQGGQAEEVPSPTFTLVQIYPRDPASLWHFDLYRLEDPEEVFELGLDQALAEGIVVIEWPSRLADWRDRLLRGDGLTLCLEFAKEPSGRRMSIKGAGRWAELCQRLGE
ncbi:MAG: tRNA (adenosine(37)-N6)-threonylcarbamoyltransferase complex ATPase subunit type 1 TsaE [Pseudomonadota bacterium]